MTTKRIEDLYDNREITDDRELLGQMLPEYDWEGFDFTVGTKSFDDLSKLVGNDGSTPVLDAFEHYADLDSEAIVEGKVKDFDEDRIIVLMGKVVLDGNHHLVAAERLGKSVRFIDLEESLEKENLAEPS